MEKCIKGSAKISERYGSLFTTRAGVAENENRFKVREGKKRVQNRSERNRQKHKNTGGGGHDRTQKTKTRRRKGAK